MASPSIQYFDISFIERTLENLKKYEGKYDFTMLLNSLLGLLVVPNEYNIAKKRRFKYPFLNEKISKFSSIKEIFKNKSYSFLDKDKKEINQYKFRWLDDNKNVLTINDITLESFLRRIRNGIAHFGITPVKEDSLWIGIIIRNYKNREMNMEVYFEEDELRTFALFIAEKYLETVVKK